MANITKAAVLDSVASSTGVSKAQAESVIDAFFVEAARAARANDRLSWPGFGTFSQRQNSARTGRNPQTGASLRIKASKGMKFTASSKLKESINQSGGSKKSAAKKAPAKKSASKKAPAKKSAAKKSAAKKSTAKKAAAKKR